MDGLPGKKGISLNKEQWADVLDGADAVSLFFLFPRTHIAEILEGCDQINAAIEAL